MQHWTKIPGLSQEDMETFFQNALLPGSELKHHGVIPQMDPVFVTCDFVKGTIDMAYHAQEWELNPENIMHGGIISTALDTSMGLLAHYYTNRCYRYNECHLPQACPCRRYLPYPMPAGFPWAHPRDCKDRGSLRAGRYSGRDCDSNIYGCERIREDR